MQKDKKKLKLQFQSVRVLNPNEVQQVRGGIKPRTGACCDLDTELLNPFTNE